MKKTKLQKAIEERRKIVRSGEHHDSLTKEEYESVLGQLEAEELPHEVIDLLTERD